MTLIRHILFGVLCLSSAVSVASAQSAPAERADAFAEAVRKGDIATVKKLLDEGVDVNTKFRYGATALFSACDRGHLEIVKLLVDRGADVNLKDTFYMATPLIWAVSPQMGRKPQHADIVGVLLQHGAQGKESALIAAVSAGDAPMTKVILAAGTLPAGILSDALEAANRGKTPEITTMLEAAGAKPRVEFAIAGAQLARYAGTYRGPGDTELVVSVEGTRLVGAVQGQRITFVARDATTFGAVDAQGATLTIRTEGDKVTSVGFPSNATTWTRVEGK